MNKKELNNMNNLLAEDVKAYYNTGIEAIKERIKAYGNMYRVLDQYSEYNKIINEIGINNSRLEFLNKCYLKDIMEIVEDYKIKINVNCLEGIDNLINYLIEVIWNIDKISIEDKKKIENRLDNIQLKEAV